MKDNMGNILVIGDVMLDKYCFGNVKRISPEAPVPVFLQKENGTVLGGAANVAMNIAASGVDVSIASVIGMDSEGRELLELIEKNNIHKVCLFEDSKRNTTVKLRYIAQNNQQILRVDQETTDEIDDCWVEKMERQLMEHIQEFDLIVLSDYSKGLLSKKMIRSIVNLSENKNIPVIADVKGFDYEKYKDLYLIKPNRSELEQLMECETRNLVQVSELAIQLCKKCNCQYVLVTCGSDGMILVNQEEKLFQISSTKVDVYDVTGAGDTALAYIARGMVMKQSFKEILEMAVIASGLQVSKVGTSPVYIDEVRKYIRKSTKLNTNGKIVGEDEIVQIRKEISGKIVFTNGCFDILHAGHLDYLQKAAKYGEILIVGLNSDCSVRKIKGVDRPINGEKERARLLAAMEYIDYVVIFNEDTPYNLIRSIVPDVLVKGGDYTIDEVVGKDIVKKNGGEVIIMPYIEGFSTTKIIKDIKMGG